MRLQTTKKHFQILVLVSSFVMLMCGVLWLPSVLVSFGVKKWMADLSMPGILGMVYVAIQWKPSLSYKYCDLVHGLLIAIGCVVEYRET
jgi:hypothetical protein